MSHFFLTLMFLCSSSAVIEPVWAKESISIEKQRALYEEAQSWLDDKQVKKYYKIKSQLDGYPLTPYLDYRSFLVNIENKPPIVVRNFIDSHKTFPFSNRIVAPYLEGLAEHKKWSALLAFQKSEPKQEKYRCYYYTAMLHVGQETEAFRGARSLWLSGDSISDDCDDLFTAWEKQGGLSDQLVIERMFLAFEQSNLSLMTYLSRKLKSQDSVDFAQTVLNVYQNPNQVVPFLAQGPFKNNMLKLVILGLKRLARNDAEQAYLLVKNGRLKSFDAQNTSAFTEYLARLLLSEDNASAADDSALLWRDTVIAGSNNVKLLELRARVEIRTGNWGGIYQWVKLLPESVRKTSRWQFWLGRSEIELGNSSSGLHRLGHLVGQRNFYSVAAASYLNEPFIYQSSPLDYDEKLIQQYQRALTRIQELVDQNKIEASKSEWQWLLNRVSVEQQAMLAQYASTSHWYHLTVLATIQAQLWGNLELRFPMAYLQWFEFFGHKYNIDPITLLSIARQESALDIKAYSPVGAKGLMQLLPSTARYMAKKYQLNYEHPSDLFNVRKNIELGSQYLNELLNRYNGNRVLAFAAYNAGPTRVDQWLERSSGDLDVYRFIESIPYRETRGYVQNILMFETYYRYLLGETGRFLYPTELETKY